MGKRSRAERRAQRKEKRAERKLKRAAKAAENGNTKRAERLTGRANVLKQKAKDIQTQIQGQVIQGLMAKVISQDPIGTIVIRTSWNYYASEMAKYDKLKLSLDTSNPFRSSHYRRTKELENSQTQWDFGPVENLRYIVKLFGIKSGYENLLDRTFCKKE